MTDLSTRAVRRVTYADNTTATICPRHGDEENVLVRLNRQRLAIEKSGSRWITLWECPVCHVIWEE